VGIRQHLKRLARSAGYTVARYDEKLDPDIFLRSLLRDERIDMVLDVGANTGQYGRALRAVGFRGPIISFEPLPDAYEQLAEAARLDGRWTALRYALGATNCHSTIHVAGNSWSSSLLPMLPGHTKAAPASAYVDEKPVEVRTLDSLAGQLCADARRVLLKVDTQGFTLAVLEGASEMLARVAALNVEMSLVPLYEGEPLIDRIAQYLYARSFRLVHLAPEFVTPSGEQLQVNGIFVRR
jgi:FkbM family methyltransferase